MDEGALHPLAKIAGIVERYGGRGMEIRERPFGRGALLRVWMPNPESAVMIGLVCSNTGIREYEIMDSLDLSGHDAESAQFTANGVQITITIPPAMVRSYQEIMNRINETPEIEEPMIALGPAPEPDA